ncbi:MULTISPECIES: rhodanese-like domain-containing protein [Psychrobacter]|uniref:rhodanese-like domain-containing protein n=1 Tax=Psychrobacter TaxID=497 RepID=UPI000E7E358E|nr:MULTISPECIES: rhodanese-like domain-containing protein [Psychrobacter]MEC9443621.1 rhodanese-like domain-containing protein [Pseudomonadota bacterium]HBL96378.1 rhodanese [Psychrobacter sp.]MBZ1391717.1 rhodanese-like domain-containing protein [Psychrobacter pacificensis]MCG3878501.1 rhodanese-like domain-containing protein [Psychrobacter sp. Ps6]MED6315731.1 rhodanese-like domain-containing protein [Pseudomonadota bacterium]
MDRALEFVGNHPFLFGILAVLAILFFTIENKRSGRKISPNTLGMMVNSQNAQLIDIRAKKKFESGYIQGSRNIPFTDLKDRLAEIRAIEQPVIIICDMGVQAGAAIQMIGKDSVYRLEGGIGGWQGAGMPLVGVKDAKSKNKAKTKPSLSK